MSKFAKTWPQLKAEWQAERDKNPAYWFWGRDRILKIPFEDAAVFLGLVQGCERRIEKAELCGTARAQFLEEGVAA